MYADDWHANHDRAPQQFWLTDKGVVYVIHMTIVLLRHRLLNYPLILGDIRQSCPGQGEWASRHSSGHFRGTMATGGASLVRIH